MESTPLSHRWTTLSKCWFRFLAAYFILFMLPWPFDSVFYPVVKWASTALLGMDHPVSYVKNGSGDSTFSWIQVFIYLILAILFTLIATVADKKRANYNTLHYLLTVAVRYYLGFVMLLYGCAKFGGQFVPPGLWRLHQSFGEASPMGLAWTFFGYSTVYGAFMGVCEIMAGLLLFFRRTQLLGACIALTVALNIVMVNLCFDIPVKILSLHLLLMSLFLLAAQGNRFISFFVLNRPLQPLNLSPVFQERKWRITRIVAKCIFLLATFGYMIATIRENNSYKGEALSALYGIYTVDEFKRNGQDVPPLVTDYTRWGTLMVERQGTAIVCMMDESADYLTFNTDTASKQILVKQYKSSNKTDTLHYTQSNGWLVLQGVFETDTVYITLKKNTKEMQLLNRGFHWINEKPYSR